MSPTILWLIAGAIFIGVEIFGIPGIGFLFAGIAAILVGGGVEFGIIPADKHLVQFVLFFILSVISAAVLWKRLKRADKEPDYQNMVGTDALVAQPGLSGGKEGQVKWSGTLLRAKIDPKSGMDVLAPDTAVTIREVDGNLVYVAPKY